MMVDTMLRAVFTMALVLVTMLLQINWTPPEKKKLVNLLHVQDKDDGGFVVITPLRPFLTFTESKL